MCKNNRNTVPLPPHHHLFFNDTQVKPSHFSSPAFSSLAHDELLCGCNDGSIQEIDLASGRLGAHDPAVQPGSKRILGKASPVYALQVHDGLLYTGSTPSSSSVDGGGTSVKVWSCANYGLVGSMATAAEARSLVVSADLVYVASRTAAVEIWSREKLARIGTLQAGGPGCRVQCMAVDADGDVLVVGTSDGRIQVRCTRINSCIGTSRA